MRHRGLAITVIILLVVFVSTLVSGLILAGTTVGWAEIGDSLRNGTFGDRFFDNIGDWSGRFGLRNIGYSIDETRTDDLQGVTSIVVRAVAERINVREGSTFTARLSGSYTGLSALRWEVSRQGGSLVVSTRYPRFGLTSSNLVMDLQIPKTFAGDVEIHTVSGTCDVVSSPDSAWRRFLFEGVSGALQAGTAVWPRVDAKTVSGAIRIDNLKGALTCNSVSGGMDLGFSVDAIPESRIETVSGRLVVSVPAQAKFNLQYETVSGALDLARLPMQVTGQANRQTQASLNGGGNRVFVKTVSGSLILQPRAG